MLAFLKSLFLNRSEVEKLVASVNTEVINAAYRNLKYEIESLRQYDRGEKNIDAPNLGATVRDLQRSL